MPTLIYMSRIHTRGEREGGRGRVPRDRYTCNGLVQLVREVLPPGTEPEGQVGLDMTTKSIHQRRKTRIRHLFFCSNLRVLFIFLNRKLELNWVVYIHNIIFVFDYYLQLMKKHWYFFLSLKITFRMKILRQLMTKIIESKVVKCYITPKF